MFDLAEAVRTVTLNSPVRKFQTTGGMAAVAVEGDVGEVVLVIVDHGLRRRGIGTRLLQMIAEWADREHLNLYLLAHPLRGLDGMDKDQLSAWYEARGWAVERVAEDGPLELLVRLWQVVGSEAL